MAAPFRPALLGLALLAGCGGGGGPMPTVEDASIRLPAVPGRPGAAYFTLHGGRGATRLVAVESPAARRIELHRSTSAGGRTTMERLDGVAVPAGGTIAFEPGGNHAMLFGMPRTLRPGDTARLTFRFEKGEAVTTRARIAAAGE